MEVYNSYQESDGDEVNDVSEDNEEVKEETSGQIRNAISEN
jgi:hypothetical protein